jgi:phage-related minor tail protein
MQAPTSQATKALQEIGITQLQLADDMRNKGFLAALTDLHDHLVDTGLTANEQGQVLSQAFGGGRSAGAIELLLNNLDRVGQKYQLIDEGVNKFSGDVQAQSETAAAKFAEAQAQMADASVKLGAALLPLIEDVMPKLVAAVTALVNWFTNLPKPVQDGILVFLGLLAALGPILVVLGSLITVVGTLITIFSAIGPIVLAVGATIAALGAPLIIIIAIVAALAIAIYTHWHQIIDWTSDMMLRVSGAWNAGWTSMADFLKCLLDALKTAVQDAMNFIMGIVNNVVNAINAAKSAAASIGGAVGNVGSTVGGYFNNAIHAFAAGGIVNGPTLALVGEAGPEAIIPLSAFAGGSGLAGSGIGGGGGITVNVTGNTISNQLDLKNLAQTVGAEIVRVLRVNQKLSI